MTRRLNIFTIRTVLFLVAFAAVWNAGAIFLAFALAAAKDNPNMAASVPWYLEWGWSIASFPTLYLLPSHHFGSVFNERMYAILIHCGIAFNGFMWGLLLIVLYRIRLRGNSGQ
jgi:hypothetical protein